MSYEPFDVSDDPEMPDDFGMNAADGCSTDDPESRN